MGVYLITYDLVKEKTGHDYEPLWAELESLGCVRTQLSAWLADLNNTQKEIYDHFLPYMDSNDRLMVLEVTKKPNWSVGLRGTKDFLEAKFTR
jgi:hypothetical protein